MSQLAMGLRQFRFENKAYWKNPAAAFFTFLFPLMFLFLFPVIFGDEPIVFFGHETSAVTFFVPAIGAFSIITATFTNNAMTLTFARDEGILKRKRGTPLSAFSYFMGRILHSMFLTLLLVTITVSVGKVFHGIDVPTNTMPAFIITILVGAAAFCALGIALTGFIPNADSAPAIVNAAILPLMFISDVFIRTQDAPEWLQTVAKVFPVYHFSRALQIAFNPFETGNGFSGEDLIVVGVWGVVGVVIAAWKFSWEPRR